MNAAQLYAEVGTSSSVGSVCDRLTEQVRAGGFRVYERSIVGPQDGTLRRHAIGWFHGYCHQVWQSGIHVHRRRLAGLQVDSAPVPEGWAKNLRRLHAAYSPSSWCLDALLPVLPDRCDTFVVPHGVDPPPSPSGPRDLSDRFTLAMLSGAGPMDYQRRKGLDVAVEACRLADARLVVKVGGNEAVEWLREQDAQHVTVRHEYLSEAERAEMLRGCHAVLVPSRAEAFGMVALEALAHGVPVVACGGTGMDDYLPDDPRAVVVPSTGDTEDLNTFGHGEGRVNVVDAGAVADAIRDMMVGYEDRRTLAEDGAETWTQDHSWHAATRPLLRWMEAHA